MAGLSSNTLVANLLLISFTLASCVAANPEASYDAPDSPLPRGGHSELRTGVLYTLAGTPSSANVWETDLTSGASRQLTKNPDKYGVSWMTASLKGVVLADARSGIDMLAVFREGEVAPLREGHAGAPVIDDAGRITYIAVPDLVGKKGPQQFRLMVKDDVDSDARVLYEQSIDLGGSAWGPSNQVAVVSAPGNRNGNGKSEIVVLDADTGAVVQHLQPNVPAYGQLVWTVNAPGIAVPAVDGQSVVIAVDGKQTAIPEGWSPRCWNPKGDKLIAVRGGNVGLWGYADPGKVQDLGASPISPLLNCSWLSAPASEVHGKEVSIRPIQPEPTS